MDRGPDTHTGVVTCLGWPSTHSRQQSQDSNLGRQVLGKCTLTTVQAACQPRVPARAACGRQEDRHKKERETPH